MEEAQSQSCRSRSAEQFLQLCNGSAHPCRVLLLPFDEDQFILTRLLSLRQLPVKLQPFGSHYRPTILAALGVRRRGELACHRFIVQQIERGRRQRRMIAARHDAARGPVRHDVGNTARVGRDDR